MRRLAEERAQRAQREKAAQAKQATEVSPGRCPPVPRSALTSVRMAPPQAEAVKRREVAVKRESEAKAKEQRRAEVYAVNAILKEIFRRQLKKARAEAKDMASLAKDAPTECGEDKGGEDKDEEDEGASQKNESEGRNEATGAEAAVVRAEEMRSCGAPLGDASAVEGAVGMAGGWSGCASLLGAAIDGASGAVGIGRSRSQQPPAAAVREARPTAPGTAQRADPLEAGPCEGGIGEGASGSGTPSRSKSEDCSPELMPLRPPTPTGAVRRRCMGDPPPDDAS